MSVPVGTEGVGRRRPGRRVRVQVMALAAGGLVVAALAVAALAMLPGGGLLGPTASRTLGRTEAVAPSAGDCWSGVDVGATSRGWWRGGAPVDCAAEHTAITLVVGQLPADFPYAPDDDGNLALAGADLAAVATACRAPGWEGVGLREGSRVASLWYFPTPREWAAGARWVRCDVVLAALGPLSPMTLELLPASADALLPGLADEYRLCLETQHPAFVYGPWYDPPGNVAVPCTQRAQWELGFRNQVPDGPYPGSQDASSPGGQRCQELVNSRVPERWGGRYESPSAESWAEGDRSERCWLR